MGRKGIEVVVSELEREQLLSMSRSRSLPHSLVRRAKIVLMAADGHMNHEIATQCEVTSPAITHWKKRFVAQGLAGLRDEARPGRPRAHDDETVAELLAKVLHEKPEGATHWSVRSAAAQTGISKSSVARYLSLFGVQPHRSKSFKLSTDPYFVEKVRDIVGLYLSPSTNVLVLCVDEKSQCQALERTQPVLPMGLGYLEGVTHDYIRHGTTTLFAALNAATGEVITQCRSRHRHQEFLAFLKHVDQAVPQDLDVHLVVDNYATHKHPKVKAWLAKHTRYHMHFTPTYSSWLNQVERWFGLITQQAIRRGSFRNVRQLIASIERYVAQYNQQPRRSRRTGAGASRTRRSIRRYSTRSLSRRSDAAWSRAGCSTTTSRGSSTSATTCTTGIARNTRCPQGQVLPYSTTNRAGYQEFRSDPARCGTCEVRGKCTGSANHVKVVIRHVWERSKERVDARRLSDWGKAIYKRRKETAERSFADAKQLHGQPFLFWHSTPCHLARMREFAVKPERSIPGSDVVPDAACLTPVARDAYHAR